MQSKTSVRETSEGGSGVQYIMKYSVHYELTSVCNMS